VINWGDGTPDSTITSYNDADLAHEYLNAGTHTISITGSLPWLYFNDGGDKLKIKTIEQWGNVGILSCQGMFWGCSNLVGNYTDYPDTSNVTNMASMFRGCSSFNQSVSNFDTSNVTNMDSMFNSCSIFNQSVSNFDTSNVTNMGFMFSNSFAFNQSVSNFDTSNVTNMGFMLRGCSTFNQDLSGFAIPLCADLTNFLVDTTLSTTNYDALLISFAGQTVQPSLSFHGGNAKYTGGGAAETARTSLVNDDLWTITDGGVAP
jgi:surface protein